MRISYLPAWCLRVLLPRLCIAALQSVLWLQGFPGTVNATIMYTLSEDNDLQVGAGQNYMRSALAVIEARHQHAVALPDWLPTCSQRFWVLQAQRPLMGCFSKLRRLR